MAQVDDFLWRMEPAHIVLRVVTRYLKFLKKNILILGIASCGSPIHSDTSTATTHLRDAIREFRDYASDAVASRQTRDVWELARHLFADTVCRALKINKPRPYDPNDEGRFGKDSNDRNRRDSSPQTGRRNEPKAGPSKPVSKKDLLLDEVDKRELEELERQTVEDRKLTWHF